MYLQSHTFYLFIYLFFIFGFCLFRAAPVAYGGSQARGQIGVQPPAYATATATATAMPDLSCVCDLHHSSWQCQVLNPLREARDQTRILMDPSQVP